VGTAPVFIASDPDSNRVYTANSGSGDVSLIATSNDTPVTATNSNGVSVPLTICAGPPPVTIPNSTNQPCNTAYTPTFIAITP
jgi:hypothetical protein